MKLVRFGAPGAEKPGLVDAQGVVRDLSAHVKDITGDTLSPASLDKLRKIDAKSLPAAPQGVRLGRAGRQRAQLHRRRPQLRRPRQGDGCGDPQGADPVQQAAQLHRRPQRRRDGAEGLDQARLRDRDRLRDRHARALRGGEERALPHRRLRHLQRHLRAQLPGRARRAVDEGQVRGDVRAARPVARRRATRSRTCRISPCRSTSTASAARPATPRP